jgi:hypothetical protein
MPALFVSLIRTASRKKDNNSANQTDEHVTPNKNSTKTRTQYGMLWSTGSSKQSKLKYPDCTVP